jgi:hypothetical protein
MAARNPNDVGSPGHPGADGGHQTPQQAAVTRQEGGGRDDAERNAAWSKDKASPERKGPTLGGSSQGSSDRKPT